MPYGTRDFSILVSICLVGPRPLEGRGVLYTSGGVGWGGACNNVHVNLRRKDMLLCGYCKFSGTFHSCVMPRYVSSLELSTHTSCYVTVSSLELSTHASCHAIVSSLELSTHTSCYVTVRSLELSTHASCHAIVSSLEPSMHTSYVMLRYSKFSWTFRSCVMPRYCKFSGTFHAYVIRHATLL